MNRDQQDAQAFFSGMVADGVYQRVRSDVLTGNLCPSERLRLAAVSKRYDSSVGSLREALSQLSSEGLIVFEPGRGFAVRPVSFEDLIDVSRMRLKLESEALAQAIARGDDDWEAEIIRALYMLTKSEQASQRDTRLLDRTWSERHRAFHRALLAACGSPWALRFCEILSDHAERYRSLSRANRARGRDVAGEHRQIADAAVGRRTEEALEHLATHYRRTAEAVAVHCFEMDAGVVGEQLSARLPAGPGEGKEA